VFFLKNARKIAKNVIFLRFFGILSIRKVKEETLAKCQVKPYD